MAVDEQVPGSSVAEQDIQRLHEMGYAQELGRAMGSFSNFAISFSIISILTGGITTFYLGMAAGGPRAITFGWIIVGFFTLLVGLSMAEICSAYPTAGGLYYWSAKLAKKNPAGWSWFTGWANLIGQVAVTASIDYGLATFIGFFITLYRPSFVANAHWILLFYAIVLLAHGLLNQFRVALVGLIGYVSVWWHLAGTAVIVLFLLFLPTHHQHLSFLVQSKNLTGWTGPFTGIYAFSIGLLLAQYTLTGYDASAHMTEETRGAAQGGPQGIVRAIYVSIIAAFVLNVAMLLALQGGKDHYAAIAGLGVTAGGQIFMDAIRGAGGKFLVLISIVAQFFCGLASVTANSRMIYAFSRDGAVPGHRIWHQINRKTRTPTNSIWLAVVAAFILGLPSLYQHKNVAVAFFAIVAIGTVGLYVAYIIPVFLKLRAGDSFQPGPWNLGRWSKLVGWLAFVWVIVICLLFFAPTTWPWNHQETFNWAFPVFAIAMIAVAIWYYTSAKNWFTGPKVQGTPEELIAIERELALEGE